MENIREIFSDPNALRKTIDMWKNAENRGKWIIRFIKEGCNRCER